MRSRTIPEGVSCSLMPVNPTRSQKLIVISRLPPSAWASDGFRMTLSTMRGIDVLAEGLLEPGLRAQLVHQLVEGHGERADL